jgi:hypothetical protein
VAEILDLLRTYATDVSDCAAAISVPDELAAQRDELKQLAGKIVAEIDEPLRIGFVGEFSAGKSLLLGTLVGKPDLLPTSMEPTTGNVTELRFVRAADDSGRIGIGGVEVHFFTRPEADQIGQCILDELGKAARRARLPAADVAELDANGGSWTPGFRDWCARMVPRDDAQLRKLIRELTQLRDAISAAPDWLGQHVAITWERLAEVLEIRYPALEHGLPPAPGPGSVPFTPNPAAGQLAATFPLVARVILNVTMPADAWPVSAAAANQEGFTLLDFPGIGGANSQARDLFLTRHGLEDVHTILVLVNAGHVGGTVPDTFYGFLRDLDARDGADGAEPLSARIVYCAGRFDEVPAPKTLTEDPFDTTRMTADRLLGASRPLSALLQSGHQPGLSAMRAFASSVLAISRLGLRNVPAELDLDLHAPAAERRAQEWRAIAESLRAGGTGQDLARILKSYAEDGGVSELRQQLGQHVRDNGLALRVQKTQRRLDELDELKERLENELRASYQPSEADQASPGMRAIALLRDLRRRRDRLVEQTALLRDPAQVPLAPGWSVRQDVMRKAADLVMAWPEWAATFSCVQHNVVVPEAGATDLSELEREILGEVSLTPGGGLPQRLGEFQEPFARACDELRGYARDQALAGTKRWLDDRSNSAETTDLQRRAAGLLDAEARDRLGRIAGLPMLQAAIDRILRPALLKDGIEKILKRADPEPGEEPVFPMRIGQLTNWADGSPSDDSTRHFVRVIRLRSALIDSVTDYALSCLDAVQDRIATQVSSYYGGKLTRLPDQRQFRVVVTGEQAGSPDELPDPAAALAALWRPDKDPGAEG